MSHTDPSFPRGRAAAAPSTDAPAAADAARHKRRRGGTDADSSAAYIKGQSATPTTKTTTKEFLFGSTEDDEANQQRLSSKRSRSASKDLTQENSRLSMYSKSLLPLGGGGCVVSGSSKQQQHQMGEGYIEPLQFTKFSPGFKLLAVVKQVTADLAVFSLPNLWTAYMLRSTTTGSSPPLDDCLQVDQVLAVTVVKAVQESTPSGPKRRIQVTCDPARVNPVDLNVPAATSGGGGVLCRGMIVSVQDHGLLLDLGLQRRGFLPFAEIQGDYYTTTTAASPEEEEEDSGATKGHGDGTRRLTVYRLVDCVVRGKTSTSGIVPLSLPEHIHTVTLPLSYKPALTDLIPGTLITNVTVEQAMKNGLAVTFGSGSAFRGAIELPHTGTYWVPDDNNNNINISKPKGGELTAWRQFFEEHRSLGPARVLAVDPRTKLIRLTLLPHLLALKSPKNDRLPSTGTVVSNCTVIRIDPGLGALLALPDDSIPNHTSDLPVVGDNQKRPIFKPLSDDAAYAAATRVRAVFVHISKASDETEDGKISDSRFAKQFGPTTKHTVRIVSTDNRIEGIASGATALSIVSAHVLTHADLVAGQVYKQVPVCGQLPNNQDILIDFGLGIRGLIPALHLFDQTVAASDFRNKMIKVKYAVGAKVDVRVLSVDLKTKKCLVTAKKSLVKAESIITSYDEAVSGQITTGYVSKVDDSGLYVTFFNGVFGRVTARSLSADLGVENLYENYSRGDVVQCRVLHMKKRMKTQRSLSSRSRWQLEEDDDLATEIDNEHDDRSRFHYELTLSLRLDHAKNATDDHVERLPSKIDLSAGFILPLKSLRVVELVPGKTKVNDTRFIPGYAIVSIKSKYMVGEAEAASMPLHMDCKLPYDQLLDQYNTDDIADAGKLDEFATRILTIGKKINRKGFLLSDPKKSNTEYLSGTGQLPVLSIRPILVQTVEMQQNRREGEPVIDSVTLPSPSSSFFVGALVQGYVTSLDSRYGAFVRFLDGLTGLVPKVKNGLRLQQYSTVIVKIVAVDDKFSPPKILLGLSGMPSRVKEPVKLDRVDVADIEDFPFKSGDTINAVEITKVDFHRAHVCVLDRDWSRFNGVVQAQIHFTMVEVQKSGEKNSVKPGKLKRKGISSCHPFYSWEKGMKLTELRVLTVERHGEKLYVGITNRVKDEIGDFYIKDADKLSPGDRVTGIVTGVSKNQGLWVELSPTVSAHVPGLEVSTDVNVLNNLQKHFPLGASLDCVVMDKLAWEKTRFKYQRSRASKHAENSNRVIPFLSVLACAKNNTPSIKPLRGDLVVGRIDRKLATANPPDLMLDLRGGFVGRCCITELDEVDDWTNFPLGRIRRESDKSIETTNDTLTEEKAKSADDSFQRARYVHHWTIARAESMDGAIICLSR